MTRCYDAQHLSIMRHGFFFYALRHFKKAKKKLIKQSDYDFLVDNFIFLDIHILTSEQVES